MKYRVQVPGKLYLAGEYAVVEAGQPAVVMAASQYLWVEIKSASTGCLHSNQAPEQVLSWRREGRRIVSDHSQLFPLLISGMQIAEDYVWARGTAPATTYQVKVTSDLDHSTGQKYGLGSSGAVTVAIIKAVLGYYKQEATPLLVYQLAVLAQLRLGMTGSFGDLAASSFGGIIAYHSPDRGWIGEKMAELPLLELLDLEWRGLSIQPLQLPEPLRVLVGWTGKSASTDHLVKQVNQKVNPHFYQQFLKDSRSCLEQFITGCQEERVDDVQAALTRNRQLLQDFAHEMGLLIETSQLRALCELALAEGAVAKSSGAGGGDCGICLVTTETQANAIRQAWKQAGILPLAIDIAYID